MKTTTRKLDLLNRLSTYQEDIDIANDALEDGDREMLIKVMDCAGGVHIFSINENESELQGRIFGAIRSYRSEQFELLMGELAEITARDK